MAIYTEFVYDDKLISPVNGYICRRITKQNIKQFGFETIEDLHTSLPEFPLRTKQYLSNKIHGQKKYTNTIEFEVLVNKRRENKNCAVAGEASIYNKNPHICPRCNGNISFNLRNNSFCSRICANSKGEMSQKTKEKISKKLKGRSSTTTDEARRAGILKCGNIPREDRKNTVCIICGRDTGTISRKTCSDKCLKENASRHAKINSRLNPNCGGQRHSKRSKVKNIYGEIYTVESSYEVKLAEIFNELDIHWIRPSHIWYQDVNGDKRRYHPDFYLPEYKLYFDPKNSYLIETDIDKIDRAAYANKVMIIILGIDDITIETVKSLVRDRGNAPLLPVCNTGTLLLC